MTVLADQGDTATGIVARLTAKCLLIGFIRFQCKGLTALRAYLGYAFSSAKMAAFLRAILSPGTLGILELFTALLANENLGHFNTPYSVEALNAGGAHGLGHRVCQQVISLPKPHEHYTMLLSL